MEAIGSLGEIAAANAYTGRGFRVVARNWRCRLGELDLVVERRGVLVFCEVKSRSGAGFGGGYEAVTWRKRAKLRSLADAFLQEHGASPSAIRFDVVSVAWRAGVSDVEVFEDAF
jgi:putative endonuclease